MLSIDGKGRVNPRRDDVGTVGFCEPDLHDVGRGQAVLGNYYTHPYVPGKSALRETFSEGDFSSQVDYPGNVALLRTGDDQTRAIVKTKEFSEMVKAYQHAHPELDANDADIEFQQHMEATYNSAFDKSLKNEQSREQALEAGARATAAAYHLLYYAGTGAEVHLVESARAQSAPRRDPGR